MTSDGQWTSEFGKWEQEVLVLCANMLREYSDRMNEVGLLPQNPKIERTEEGPVAYHSEICLWFRDNRCW